MANRGWRNRVLRSMGERLQRMGASFAERAGKAQSNDELAGDLSPQIHDSQLLPPSHWLEKLHQAEVPLLWVGRSQYGWDSQQDTPKSPGAFVLSEAGESSNTQAEILPDENGSHHVVRNHPVDSRIFDQNSQIIDQAAPPTSTPQSGEPLEYRSDYLHLKPPTQEKSSLVAAKPTSQVEQFYFRPASPPASQPVELFSPRGSTQSNRPSEANQIEKLSSERAAASEISAHGHKTGNIEGAFYHSIEHLVSHDSQTTGSELPMRIDSAPHPQIAMNDILGQSRPFVKGAETPLSQERTFINTSAGTYPKKAQSGLLEGERDVWISESGQQDELFASNLQTEHYWPTLPVDPLSGGLVPESDAPWKDPEQLARLIHEQHGERRVRES